MNLNIHFDHAAKVAKIEEELSKSLQNWERCRREGDALGMRIWLLCAIGEVEQLNRASLSASPVMRKPSFAVRTASAQAKAHGVKESVRVYYSAREEGRTRREAARLACGEWERQFGKPCTEATIHNWVARIERRGGYEIAPMEAYCALS
jgi:hypothetical protein